MKLTIEKLDELHACTAGEHWFLKSGCTTVEASVFKLMEENKFNWANWILVRSLNRDNQIQYAIFAAKPVLHLFEEKYPKDLRPRKAIEAAEKYLKAHSAKNKSFAAAAAAAADAADAAAYAAAAADAKIKIIEYGIKLLTKEEGLV